METPHHSPFRPPFQNCRPQCVRCRNSRLSLGERPFPPQPLDKRISLSVRACSWVTAAYYLSVCEYASLWGWFNNLANSPAAIMPMVMSRSREQELLSAFPHQKDLIKICNQTLWIRSYLHTTFNDDVNYKPRNNHFFSSFEPANKGVNTLWHRQRSAQWFPPGSSVKYFLNGS